MGLLNFSLHALVNSGEIKTFDIGNTDIGKFGFGNCTIRKNYHGYEVMFRQLDYCMIYVNAFKNMYPNSWRTRFPLDLNGSKTYSRLYRAQFDENMNLASNVLSLKPDIKEITIDTSVFDGKEMNSMYDGLEDVRSVEYGKYNYIGGHAFKKNLDVKQCLFNINSENRITNLKVLDECPTDYKFQNGSWEKNWMPIEDEPNRFVRFANPTTIVEYDGTNGLKTVKVVETPEFRNYIDMRGGSQVIRIGDYRVAFVHECMWLKTYTYTHRIIVWDLDWNIVNISKPFTFNLNPVEFIGGACVSHDGTKVIITFGNGDMVATYLTIPCHTLLDFALNNPIVPIHTLMNKGHDKTNLERLISNNQPVHYKNYGDELKEKGNLSGAVMCYSLSMNLAVEMGLYPYAKLSYEWMIDTLKEMGYEDLNYFDKCINKIDELIKNS